MIYTKEIAKLRSLVYYGFSRLVDYPYDEDVGRLSLIARDLATLLEALTRYYEHISKALKYLKEALTVLPLELKKLGRDEFQAEYVSTFELGLPQPPCPLRETAFIDEAFTIKRLPAGMIVMPALIVLASLEEHYGREGLEYNRYPPDHLVVELEFMHYLTSRECKCLSEGDYECLRQLLSREEAFLSKHLSWLNKLRSCVLENSKLATYKHIISSLAEWVEADKKIISAQRRGL